MKIMVTKYSIEVNHGLEKNCGYSSGSTIEVNHLLKIVLAPILIDSISVAKLMRKNSEVCMYGIY